jgi:hypothetical protein
MRYWKRLVTIRPGAKTGLELMCWILDYNKAYNELESSKFKLKINRLV